MEEVSIPIFSKIIIKYLQIFWYAEDCLNGVNSILTSYKQYDNIYKLN